MIGDVLFNLGVLAVFCLPILVIFFVGREVDRNDRIRERRSSPTDGGPVMGSTVKITNSKASVEANAWAEVNVPFGDDRRLYATRAYDAGRRAALREMWEATSERRPSDPSASTEGE